MNNLGLKAQRRRDRGAPRSFRKLGGWADAGRNVVMLSSFDMPSLRKWISKTLNNPNKKLVGIFEPTNDDDRFRAIIETFPDPINNICSQMIGCSNVGTEKIVSNSF